MSFVKFKDPKTGEALDEVRVCQDLLAKKNILIPPASLCFELEDVGGRFKGRARIGFTMTTENLQKGLKLLEEYLQETK